MGDAHASIGGRYAAFFRGLENFSSSTSVAERVEVLPIRVKGLESESANGPQRHPLSSIANSLCSTNANVSPSANNAAFCYCLFHFQPELGPASRSIILRAKHNKVKRRHDT